MEAATSRVGSAAATLPAPAPAPARPRPRRPAPGRTRRRRPAHRVPHAVGRTAQAVSSLPESGAVVGLARGRLWIAALGVLLIGIVGVNLLNVSYGAKVGKTDSRIQSLERDNSILRAKRADLLSMPNVQAAAASAGMALPAPDQVDYRTFSPGDIAAAAQRLAAAGGG